MTEQSYVYFIQAKPSGRIKIGVSANPSKRLAGLKTACPEDLVILGAMPGSAADERDLHSQFEEDRLRGEWFTPSAALLTFIENQCPTLPNGSPLDLSLAEAAALLDLAPRTVRLHKHRIGYTLRNGQLRFRREDVQAYAQRDYRPPQAETAPTPIRRVVQTASRVGLVTGRTRGVGR